MALKCLILSKAKILAFLYITKETLRFSRFFVFFWVLEGGKN